MWGQGKMKRGSALMVSSLALILGGMGPLSAQAGVGQGLGASDLQGVLWRAAETGSAKPSPLAPTLDSAQDATKGRLVRFGEEGNDQILVTDAVISSHAYGDYLAGRAAKFRGDSVNSARFMMSAARGAPEIGFLRERAFTSALMAGMMPEAAEMAPTGPETLGSLRSLAGVVRTVHAFARGQTEAARTFAADTEAVVPYAASYQILLPLVLAEAKDWDGAIKATEVEGDVGVRVFNAAHRVAILEAAGRIEEADQGFQKLAGPNSPMAVYYLGAYAEFLERQGRFKDAEALYRRGLALAPKDQDFQAALVRVLNHGTAPRAKTFQALAAFSYTNAASLEINQRRPELGLTYLRMALDLDPKNTRALALTGDIMAGGGDFSAARDLWGQIPPSAPEFLPSRVNMVISYRAENQMEEALGSATETYAQSPLDQGALILKTDLLCEMERPGEALKDISAFEARPKSEALNARALYVKGTCLHKSGEWPAAEAAFQKALALSPNDVAALNYLGYYWVDQGGRVKEGMKLIERAHALRPDSPAILDSLGWCHYRLGNYVKALSLIEESIALDATDPEVNDHLGDVYWRLGRRTEARFQWARVLTLNPAAQKKQEIAQKLKSGLGGHTLLGKPLANGRVAAH